MIKTQKYRNLWELNRKFKNPERIPEIQKKDIPIIAERALQEANPRYPVPVIFEKKN